MNTLARVKAYKDTEILAPRVETNTLEMLICAKQSLLLSSAEIQTSGLI